MSTTTATPPRWATEPFVMGTPDQCARLRAWLVDVGFTERTLCAAADVRTVAHFRALADGRTVFNKATDPLSLLVMLLLDGTRVPWDIVRSVFPAEGLKYLDDLGLLQSAVSDAALCVSPIALFPYEDLYVAADRLGTMEVIGEGIPSDLVYSPLTAETLRYVGLMPRSKCADFLEMCGGSGIAALVAAKQFAARATSADITERSTRFAQFNGLLNGLDNYEAVRGDLYQPVAGRTFDLIVAHPPYVPAVETAMVFRDGGEDGEQITRAIIARLNDHLRPGGLFYLECFMTDRGGSPLEQRIRRMLGPSEDDFDVVLLRNGTLDPMIFHADRLRLGRISPDVYRQQTATFERLGIERFVAATVLIQRRTAERPVVTRRRLMSPATRAEHLEWLIRYLTATADWGTEETRLLLDSRPRLLPSTELRMKSAFNDGEWRPSEMRVVSLGPFAVESPCPAFLPVLLGRCDGRATARELLAQLRVEGRVSTEKSDDDFALLLRELADVPYIELDTFPLPEIVSAKPAGVA